jgi:hypothetical protein
MAGRLEYDRGGLHPLPPSPPRETTLRPAPDVAKKVARKSARIAHELPSDELTSCAPEAKSLLMHTIFRVE